MLRHGRRRARIAALTSFAGLCALTLVIAPGPPQLVGPAPRRGSIIVDSARGALNVFRPERAWGAALDGHEKDELAAIYTPGNIAAMNSAGFGPVTYRLRTELAIEAWHWNPRGRWSDADHARGYWTSSDSATAPIERSYGYRLPRRGRTIDDANNDGYSRLDDGDTASFWKSNPYLDPRFTDESEAAHAQWVVVDLGEPRTINAARLAWGAPFARRYVLEYWDGDQTIDIDRNPSGTWRTFPRGEVADGSGGDVTLVLAPLAVATRFVRVTMLESSHTAAGGGGDPRDSLGFALREISLGTMDLSGVLHDVVRHGRSAARQSEVLVSSTDPWHRESDRDDNVEQPGLDLVVRSGLTHGLPLLVPVPVLFDTPENAAALLRFLRRRGYAVPRIELGEEPDGQRVSPEDFAALYLQVADALRAEDPDITLGGPSRQNLFDEPLAIWPGTGTAAGPASWTGRVRSWLAARHHARDLAFFSFEWYPFDDACAPTAPALARAPGLLDAALEHLRQNGLPDSIPLILTEYGYSAHAGPAEVELASALFNADALARFFAAGGAEAYVYGWEPGYLGRWARCADEGNNLLFLADDEGRARYLMPAYHAARLLTRAWADSAGGRHEMFAASVRAATRNRESTLVSAFALRRPDHRWSLLLINRDPARAWSVDARIGDAAEGRPLGPFEVWQYSRAQYAWRGDGARGHPVRDEPPTHGGAPSVVLLPPYSITVLVERFVSLAPPR